MNQTQRIRRLLKYSPVAALLALLASCASPPEYPIEPHIEFVSLSKDTLRRAFGNNFFLDTLYITFSFTDGDGDIGDAENDRVFITDLRNNETTRLEIPFVPELGASNGIKGKITARQFTKCCDYPDSLFLIDCQDVLASLPYDLVNFELYIVDREDHKSNVIQLPPVYIQCFE